MNTDSFLYKWHDVKTKKYYIGVHKGTPNDGYICSSKLFLEEYQKRPNDFKRGIIMFGSFGDLVKKESHILKTINAAKNKNYYNQHNGDGKFYCKNHTTKTKKLLQEKLKKYKKTKKHCLSISESKKGIVPKCTYTRRCYKGKNNPNYGKKQPEVGKKISEKLNGIYIIEGKTFFGLKEVMEKYKLNSTQSVFYRLNSKSKKFMDWNYGN